MIVDAVSIVRNANVVMEAVVTASVTMILGSLPLPNPAPHPRSDLPLPMPHTNQDNLDLADPLQGTPPLGDSGQGRDLDQDPLPRW